MESNSGEIVEKKDTLKDILKEEKRKAEEQEALDKQFSIPPKALFDACGELNQIHK